MAKHDVRVPAALWDEWQPKLKPAEWLLFCAILRKTYGWDKMMDIVSTSQLVAMTGMTERRVQRNMASLLKSGAPIEVMCRGRHGTVYRIACPDSVSGDVTRYLSSDTGDGLQGPTPLLHSDAGIGTHREFTSIPTPVSPTTLSSKGVHVSEDPVTGIYQGTEQGAVARPRSLDDEGAPITDSLVNKEGLAGSALTTSKDFEDGLVGKTNAVDVDPAPVSLEGSPTSQPLFVNPKTGKTWEVGQDVACLAYELKITRGEAQSILEDGAGKDAGSILAILKESWTGIKGASNRVAYMRGVFRKLAPGVKANLQAKPTSKPLPRCAAPLPFAEQAPAAPTASAKPAVDDNSIDLGPIDEAAGEWGDWADKGNTEPVAIPGDGLFSDDDVPAPAVEVPAAAVDPYKWLSEPPPAEPDSTYTPSDDDDDVFRRPGLPDSPAYPDVPTLILQHEQDLQAARDMEHAAVSDRLNAEMALEAITVQEPVEDAEDTVPPAPAADTEEDLDWSEKVIRQHRSR
jgi:hypothetical protein